MPTVLHLPAADPAPDGGTDGGTDGRVMITALLAGDSGLRAQLQRHLGAAQALGDVARANRMAIWLIVHTLADFADFRGLAAALSCFDPALPVCAGERCWADAALLGRPMLDHQHDYADPALTAARERLLVRLRTASGGDADAHLLLAKVCIDHASMVNDFASVERLLALMQASVPKAAPRWQAAWWLLAAQNLEYLGRNDQARAATQRLQALAERLQDPELGFAAAAEDLRLALHVGDLVRADRDFRTLEQHAAGVRPALLPRGLRTQVALLLRRGAYGAALERTALMLAICEDHEVPLRDRAGYIEQRAHALAGLGRHDEAVALLASLRPTQQGGQAQVLEVIIAMARAMGALDAGRSDASALALAAVRSAAAVDFHRFLMSFPAWAGRIAALALDAGVETEFVSRVVQTRRLPPPEPAREHWPWALQVRAMGGLRLWREGSLLTSEGGKAPRKPRELLALLVAHPGGLDAETLINALWPSLDADAPRASLEMAISRLRKWLELPDAVRVADARVQLDMQRVWTDVAALDAAAAAGDAERTLALYRGPLLQGERLTGLAAAGRERLAAQLASVVLRRAANLREQGLGAEALALLGRALAVEPGSVALQAALRA